MTDVFSPEVVNALKPVVNDARGVCVCICTYVCVCVHRRILLYTIFHGLIAFIFLP